MSNTLREHFAEDIMSLRKKGNPLAEVLNSKSICENGYMGYASYYAWYMYLPASGSSRGWGSAEAKDLLMSISGVMEHIYLNHNYTFVKIFKELRESQVVE